MCLHSIYITIVVSTIEIIPVTNRKNVYNIIVKREILYWYAFLANHKFPFYAETESNSEDCKEIGKVCL